MPRLEDPNDLPEPDCASKRTQGSGLGLSLLRAGALSCHRRALPVAPDHPVPGNERNHPAPWLAKALAAHGSLAWVERSLAGDDPPGTCRTESNMELARQVERIASVPAAAFGGRLRRPFVRLVATSGGAW